MLFSDENGGSVRRIEEVVERFMTNADEKRSGTLSRTDRRRRKTRDKLIKAAMDVFADKGIDATSVMDITERADLGIGTFYTYFPAKEDIVAGVVADKLADLSTKIERHAQKFEDGTINTVLGARCLVQLLLKDEAFDWLSARPEILVREMLNNTAPAAVADAADGVLSGKFSVNTADVRLQVMGLWGLVGFISASRALGQFEDADKVFATAFLRALGADPATIDELLAIPLPDFD